MATEKVVDLASTDTRWKDGKHLDFDKIKAWGASRAILRCTYGVEFIDPEYDYNSTNCLRVDLPFSSYHLFVPSEPADEQLDYFLEFSIQTVLQDALDVEVGSGMYLTPRVALWLKSYKTRTTKRPLMYSNLNYLYNYLKDTPRLVSLADLWLAYPSAGTMVPVVKGWPKVKGWQYTFKAVVPGVPDAGVDVSRFYE